MAYKKVLSIKSSVEYNKKQRLQLIIPAIMISFGVLGAVGEEIIGNYRQGIIQLLMQINIEERGTAENMNDLIGREERSEKKEQ